MIFKEEICDSLVQVKMKKSEKEALKKLAKEHGMSLSKFIKNACNLYADKLKKADYNKKHRSKKAAAERESKEIEV